MKGMPAVVHSGEFLVPSTSALVNLFSNVFSLNFLEKFKGGAFYRYESIKIPCIALQMIGKLTLVLAHNLWRIFLTQRQF